MTGLVSWLLEQIDADHTKASRQVIHTDSGSPVFYSGNLTDEDGEHGGGWIRWRDGGALPASYQQFSELVEREHPEMIHTSDPHMVAVCVAHRQIVELHRDWPVFVEYPQSAYEPLTYAPDGNTIALQMSQRFQWMTEQAFREKFGDEPPTAPMIRALAAVYQDRPGFDPGWLE